MSVLSLSPLNTQHISVSALPISILQLFRQTARFRVCVSVYYCCPLSPSLMTYLRSDYVHWGSHVWLTDGNRRDCDLPLLFLTEQHTNIIHCWSGLSSSSYSLFFSFITEHHIKQVAMCPMLSICLY